MPLPGSLGTPQTIADQGREPQLGSRTFRGKVLQPGPPGLQHTRSLGAPALGGSVSPASIVQSRSIGQPSLVVARAPRVYRTTEPHSYPLPSERSVIVSGLAVSPTLLPTSLVHARQIGQPTVNPNVLAQRVGVAVAGSSNYSGVKIPAPQYERVEIPLESRGFIYYHAAPPILFPIVPGGTNQSFVVRPALEPIAEKFSASRAYVRTTQVVPGSVFPSGLQHSRALGALVLNDVLRVTALDHGRTLGAPVVSPKLLLAGLVHTRGVSNGLTVQHVNALLPASLSHTRAIGTPFFYPAPTSLTSTRALGNPTITSTLPGVLAPFVLPRTLREVSRRGRRRL